MGLVHLVNWLIFADVSEELDAFSFCICHSLECTDDGRNVTEISASCHKRPLKRKIRIILLRVNSFSKKCEILKNVTVWASVSLRVTQDFSVATTCDM